MGNFKRNNRSDKRGFAGRDSGRPAMHKVVCSECGKDCEVPFKPTGDKPVFCSDCFSRKKGTEPRRFDRKDSGRSSFSDRKMHKVVCDECGKDCEVPFKPTSDKPIYCSQCFSDKGKDKTSSQTSKQLEAIDAKLDEILKALSSSVSAETDKKMVKKTKTSKPKKTSKSKEKKKKVVSPKKTKTKKKK